MIMTVPRHLISPGCDRVSQPKLMHLIGGMWGECYTWTWGGETVIHGHCRIFFCRLATFFTFPNPIGIIFFALTWSLWPLCSVPEIIGPKVGLTFHQNISFISFETCINFLFDIWYNWPSFSVFLDIFDPPSPFLHNLISDSQYHK